MKGYLYFISPKIALNQAMHQFKLGVNTYFLNIETVQIRKRKMDRSSYQTLDLSARGGSHETSIL